MDVAATPVSALDGLSKRLAMARSRRVMLRILLSAAVGGVSGLSLGSVKQAIAGGPACGMIGCIDFHGVCQAGTYNEACGANGGVCAVCGPGFVCGGGVCQCNGCVAGVGICLPGTAAAACGFLGVACAVCGPSTICASGGCAICSGCIDSSGNCQPGFAVNACGSGGTTCTTCVAEYLCVAGICLPPSH